MIRYGTIGTNKITNEFIEAATISRKWELTAVYADDAKELRQNVRDCFSQCKNPNQSSAWYLHHRLCREDRFWKQEIQLDDD